MTSSSIPYWHVDAFAARPFCGNQAAVMLLDDWLPDETLVAIAEENKFAETAFLVRSNAEEVGYELRWFTPTSEVAMCGHATLASGHVLLTGNEDDTVSFRTRKAGILKVSRIGRGYELSLPVTLVEPRRNDGLLEALGATGEVFESVAGAEDTAIVLLDSAASVRALQPDMRALTAINLMAICTAPGDDGHDIVSRVFVPAWGVDEDSVTGAAHAALTPFWADRLERGEFTAHQASARGGNLNCRLEGSRAILGGECVTVVEGRFYLPR